MILTTDSQHYWKIDSAKVVKIDAAKVYEMIIQVFMITALFIEKDTSANEFIMHQTNNISFKNIIFVLCKIQIKLNVKAK